MWSLLLFPALVSSLSFPWTTPLISGKLDELQCDVQTLSSMNDQLYLKLQELKRRKFFTIFKVKLDGQCPFWAMDYFCEQATCAVCECREDEVPAAWKETTNLASRMATYKGWNESEPAWIFEEEPDTYVNLLKNAEAFTGYQGQHIWKAIYNENCFGDNQSELCSEERLFYQIVSGLHTNINCHISYNYVGETDASSLEEAMEQTYPNLTMFHSRVAIHPDRIRNFYIAFALLIRATNKAVDWLNHFDYRTGETENDLATTKLVQEVLNITMRECLLPFNEVELFSQPSGPLLKEEIRRHFYNISRIMDCVGCEKCRLHGKVQIYGLGTALRILFSDAPSIQRNELIVKPTQALINTLAKFSKAEKVMRRMKELEIEGEVIVSGLVLLVLIVYGAVAVKCWGWARSKPRS